MLHRKVPIERQTRAQADQWSRLVPEYQGLAV